MRRFNLTDNHCEITKFIVWQKLIVDKVPQPRKLKLFVRGTQGRKRDNVIDGWVGLVVQTVNVIGLRQ